MRGLLFAVFQGSCEEPHKQAPDQPGFGVSVRPIGDVALSSAGSYSFQQQMAHDGVV